MTNSSPVKYDDLARNLPMRAVLSLLTILIVMSTFTAAQSKPHKQASKPAPPANWDTLVEEFFSQNYFKFGPTGGTAAGFHQYDPLLEDYSRATMEKEILSLKDFRSRFEDFSPEKLNEEQRGDRLVALSNITSSLFVIMSRNFAPPEARLRSVIAREKQMPTVFDAAHANLNNPPKIYTQVALMQLPGIISFFQKDVPDAFKNVHDEKLLK